MKFSLIIGNPPYNRNVDLKILCDVYSLSHTICFIHPSMWLYNNVTNGLHAITKRLVKNSFAFYEVVPNSTFGDIMMFQDTAITFFDKDCKEPVSFINGCQTTMSSITCSIKEKVEEYTIHKESLLKKCSMKNEFNKWECGIPRIRGHYNNTDLSTLIRKTGESEHIGISTPYMYKFLFKTEEEATNFKDFLKLKVTRFIIGIYKYDQNVHKGLFKHLPLMPTYLRSWNNNEVAEELGLTLKEIKWILQNVPNYYEEDF